MLTIFMISGYDFDVSSANQTYSTALQQQQRLPLVLLFCLPRVSVSTYGTHTRTLSMNTSALRFDLHFAFGSLLLCTFTVGLVSQAMIQTWTIMMLLKVENW